MRTFEELCFNFGEIYGKNRAPYVNDIIKGTFGKCGSSHSESNHVSFKKNHTECRWNE